MVVSQILDKGFEEGNEDELSVSRQKSGHTIFFANLFLDTVATRDRNIVTQPPAL